MSGLRIALNARTTLKSSGELLGPAGLVASTTNHGRWHTCASEVALSEAWSFALALRVSSMCRSCVALPNGAPDAPAWRGDSDVPAARFHDTSSGSNSARSRASARPPSSRARRRRRAVVRDERPGADHQDPGHDEGVTDVRRLLV